MVIDYQRNFRESAGIEGTDPLHDFGILTGVLVDKTVSLTPFAKAIGVDKIDLVNVIVLTGKSLDEAAVFFLKNRIVRIGGTDNAGADFRCEVFRSGIENIIRSVLALVAAVHDNPERKFHAAVENAAEQTVEP